MLDPLTLWGVIAFVTALLATGLLFVWWLTPSEPALVHWSSALCFFILGIVSGLYRLEWPYFLAVGLGNACFLIGYAQIWAGLRRFDGHPVSPLLAWAIPVIWVGAVFVPPFSDDPQMRVVLISLLIGLLIMLSLRQLWRVGLRTSMARLTLFVTLLVAMVLNLSRIPLLGAQVRGNRIELFNSPSMAWFGLLGVALGIFVCFAIVLLVRERSDQQYHLQAGRDDLTGLLNRRGFMERAIAVTSAGGPLAVMFLDLDHFKQINDRFGHAAGDSVLMMVAQVLRDNVREGDVVGRVGGEEFLVLLPGADDGAAWAAAERVQRGLRQAAISLRMGAYDSPLECTASIGLAIANLPAAASAPMQEGRLRTLIDRADKVLYQAKNDGRNRIEVVHV